MAQAEASFTGTAANGYVIKQTATQSLSPGAVSQLSASATFAGLAEVSESLGLTLPADAALSSVNIDISFSNSLDYYTIMYVGPGDGAVIPLKVTATNTVTSGSTPNAPPEDIQALNQQLSEVVLINQNFNLFAHFPIENNSPNDTVNSEASIVSKNSADYASISSFDLGLSTVIGWNIPANFLQGTYYPDNTIAETVTYVVAGSSLSATPPTPYPIADNGDEFRAFLKELLSDPAVRGAIKTELLSAELVRHDVDGTHNPHAPDANHEPTPPFSHGWSDVPHGDGWGIHCAAT